MERLRKAGLETEGGYGCFSKEPPASGTKARGQTAADVPLPTNECTGDEDGSWYATRTMQCEIDPNVKYTYYSSDGKTVLGTARFAIAQQLDLSVNSLKWKETDQLTMLAADKISGLGVTMTTSCSATCSPSTTQPWAAQTPITVGQTLKATYDLQDNPTSAYDYLDQSYELTIHLPGAVLLSTIKWGGVEVRCDDKISIANSSGCVIPWYTPTLRLSRTLYGSSVDMIDWAQRNLSGHWGLKGAGEPLHRLQSESQKKANRQALCGTNKFTPDPGIPDDSCDEYPFAGVYESGALNGVDHGKDCAQVTAVQADSTGDLATDWPTITPLGTWNVAQKCVRGHIPGSLNSEAGGWYGTFVKSARLADDDPFWVSVVA
ncbi:hypothetical protein ABT174_38655 [Streptomyces sparsogenes]|uniref:hypothetical protein n=1 Tax=Streptomyces sparsogenes TaxID=67365 RepID=UPI00332264F2